jgi:hypothetical protein
MLCHPPVLDCTAETGSEARPNRRQTLVNRRFSRTELPLPDEAPMLPPLEVPVAT